MSIRVKLFITFFVFSIVLTFTMGGLMKWSFHQGFAQYVLQKQQERLQSALPLLEKYYARYGNWNRIQRRPRSLHKLLTRLPDPNSHQDKHALSPSEMHFLASVYLLDNHKQLIAGNYVADDVNQELAIIVDDNVVGFLGALKMEKPLTHIERRFEERQGRSLFYIISVSLLLSLIFSWPLSKALIKRVQLIADHIRQLNRGNYNKHVSVGGHDELTGITDHLNHLGQSLQQSEQARRKLVADISHELRTPLATLQAQLEALEDGIHQYNDTSHNRLKEQVSRLGKLVDDLYTLSLADVGALQYHKNHCDINEILSAVIHSFQPQFEQANIELSFDKLSAGKALIYADEKRLTQLFSNLLQNSLHYTDAPGKTRVSGDQTDKHYCIIIEDSAPGVALPERAHLLERLYRADSSRNRQRGGAGLGLSLCQSIVSAHNGVIKIDESTLGGLKISLQLPVNG